jgi:type I restriction enzyme, S subunit
MASEWRTARIEEVAEKVGMGPFGSSIKVSTFVPDGIPVISGQHLHGTRLRDTTFNFVSPEHADKLRNANVYRGDVVFTHAGNIGQAAYIPETSRYERYVLSQRQFFLRCDRRKLLPEFAAYFFSTAEGQHRLLANASQVGVPSIARPVTYLRTIEIPLPPLPEQRAIANVLGTLDDKIELNRRTNETLESIARALFKSWFVDFDPVRAKSEGRDPGLPPHLADLFPDSLEDSALGEIPKGWRVGKLGDVLAQRLERCVPSPETEARPYVPIDCISSKSLSLTESKPGKEAQSSLTKFYKGDLLFGAMRPYFHKVCIAPFDGTTRTTAFVLFPRAIEDFSFATLLLHDPETIGYATRHSTGSTIPYAVWTGSLDGMPAIVPPPPARRAFDRVVFPILMQLPEAYFQSRTLAAVRDTLLPKLISGELRLTAAERVIGAG